MQQFPLREITRSRRLLYGLLSITLLASALHLRLASAQLNPYQIKAVFLFNFSKFVTWPKSSLSGSHFNICVLGNNPFGVYLDLTLEGAKANNRLIRARQLQRLDQMSTCSILFISISEHGRLEKILALTGNQAILTVSDIQDFAKNGGCIEIRRARQKMRLIINQASVERAGLSIRANLLQLSEVIRDNE